MVLSLPVLLRILNLAVVKLVVVFQRRIISSLLHGSGSLDVVGQVGEKNQNVVTNVLEENTKSPPETGRGLSVLKEKTHLLYEELKNKIGFRCPARCMG